MREDFITTYGVRGAMDLMMKGHGHSAATLLQQVKNDLGIGPSNAMVLYNPYIGLQIEPAAAIFRAQKPFKSDDKDNDIVVLFADDKHDITFKKEVTHIPRLADTICAMGNLRDIVYRRKEGEELVRHFEKEYLLRQSSRAIRNLQDISEQNPVERYGRHIRLYPVQDLLEL
jgi:hypothetical protein